jgi:hypothetical protein
MNIGAGVLALLFATAAALSPAHQAKKVRPGVPGSVLEVRHPKDPLPGGNCQPIPATAGALVIISRITRPA